MAKGGGIPGNFNMNNLMKQAQKMQRDMEKAQQSLETVTVETTSGGGAVKVVMNGKKVVTSLEINPEVVDPDDVEMLQDLVLTAVNEAIRQVEETANSEMSKVTGGLNMNGLF